MKHNSQTCYWMARQCYWWAVYNNMCLANFWFWRNLGQALEQLEKEVRT